MQLTGKTRATRRARDAILPEVLKRRSGTEPKERRSTFAVDQARRDAVQVNKRRARKETMRAVGGSDTNRRAFTLNGVRLRVRNFREGCCGLCGCLSRNTTIRKNLKNVTPRPDFQKLVCKFLSLFFSPPS